MDIPRNDHGPGPRFSGLPRQALIDAPVEIRLAGFMPQHQVTVRARMQDDLQRWWASHATFVTDAHGAVDVATTRPLAGTYDDVDPMGLFWSMVPDPHDDVSAPFLKLGVTPTTMTFTAEVMGAVVASATLERLLVGPGVSVEPVRSEGLVGTLFRPEGPGPHPGVLVVGGSGGALRGSEQQAALLASHGYASLVLAYFAYEHLPPVLIDIPLEYFEAAMHWLLRQPGVHHARLAVLGTSRGGELALLLGATFPLVTAVVAYVPSGLIWGGFGGEDTGVQPAAWTYRGAPLPFVSHKHTSQDVIGQRANDEPIAFTPAFLADLEDAAAVAAATIPVERIGGPILLISGQDDQMWPSATLADIVMKRMEEHAFPFTYRHLSYSGAGHAISFPYLPTTVSQVRHPVAGVVCALGGNARDGAAARRDSWEQVLAFLHENVGR